MAGRHARDVGKADLPPSSVALVPATRRTAASGQRDGTQNDMTEDDAQRSWHFKQLRQALHALAVAESDQPALFPDAVASADDLAFGFDHWSDLVRDSYGADLTRPQTEALDAIERKLATMSHDSAEFDVDVWTDAALSTSDHWADLRRLATGALEAFGWAAPADAADDESALREG